MTSRRPDDPNPDPDPTPNPDPDPNPDPSPNQETLALDVEAMCRFRAHELLLSCDRWPQAKFLEEWADQMPQGVTPDAGEPEPEP